MQAKRLASVGTCANSAGVKTAAVHQQASCGRPVTRSISLAQALGWPHRGHLLVSRAWSVGIFGMAGIGLELAV